MERRYVGSDGSTVGETKSRRGRPYEEQERVRGIYIGGWKWRSIDGHASLRPCPTDLVADQLGVVQIYCLCMQAEYTTPQCLVKLVRTPASIRLRRSYITAHRHLAEIIASYKRSISNSEMYHLLICI